MKGGGAAEVKFDARDSLGQVQVSEIWNPGHSYWRNVHCTMRGAASPHAQDGCKTRPSKGKVQGQATDTSRP